LDELFWFIGKRKGSENGINTYVMTALSREVRQIVGFCVDNSVNAAAIQGIVDSAPQAEVYSTDGCQTYLGVIFPGYHNRNIKDKSDTHNIEGSNADIRHYIAGLQRKSRCFFRKIETLKAVLGIFVHVYNCFGDAKLKYRKRHPKLGRDFPFSHIDFV
jgi:IS1 family transposase